MNNYNKIGSIIFAFGMVSNGIAAMEAQDTQEDNIAVVVVPGLNGGGGQNLDVIYPHLKNRIVASCPNGIWQSDLGQNNCLNHLNDTMKTVSKDNKIKSIIIHGCSQGGATAYNGAVDHQVDNPQKIDVLVLEAAVASGNSAILQKVPKLVAGLPLSYYWAPYIAKLVMPRYAPAGRQPILQTAMLQKDLPIIIMHDKNDPEIPYDDAKALYTGLKNAGQENVYFIETNDGNHGSLLWKEQHAEQITAFHMILARHIKKQKIADEGLKKYQPPVDKEAYAKLVIKENRMPYVDLGVKTAFYASLCYGAYRIYKYFKPQ
ncbi:alpha/beta hydrolase [Candidatus Dependentiae bacterium]|nr:alpha/beta hydrolase [Candidatus Dependentiae bacterium]